MEKEGKENTEYGSCLPRYLLEAAAASSDIGSKSRRICVGGGRGPRCRNGPPPSSVARSSRRFEPRSFYSKEVSCLEMNPLKLGGRANLPSWHQGRRHHRRTWSCPWAFCSYQTWVCPGGGCSGQTWCSRPVFATSAQATIA